MPRFDVKTASEGQPVEGLGPGHFDEGGQVFSDMPEFSFTAQNENGINARILQSGVELDILREEEHRFNGIIDTVEPIDDQQDSRVEVQGVHVGYKLLQARICDSYDFDEDGLASTTRDAVTINPWRTIIFREPGGTLDAQGNLPALTGVRPDEFYKMLIGTKFISQISLRDTRYFLPSTVSNATSTKVTVWKDGQDGDVRPSFQFVRDGDNYVTGGTAETIPLINGDPNIDEMGDISTVKVEAIGVYDGTHDLTADVCRNAYDTRNYSTVSLTREDNWNGTTFSRWTGEIDLSGDGSTNKNALGAKLGFTPDDGPTSTTSKVYYLRFDAVTESDTGLSEGTIETYSNPVTFGDGGENWIETDVLTENRLEAAERVRKMTESDGDVNSSPHWDMWIDQSLNAHFSERRGSDITGHEYSFHESNLDVIRHRYFGGEKAYQTVAYGAGSGRAQTRIVSKAEFSNGGLYDSDRDPDNGGDRNYRVMKFVDQNEKSATNLLRKARAFHKLHRDPIETFEVEIRSEYVRIFETGDGIKVVNLNTRTNDTIRVVRLTRKWGDGGIGEDLVTTIGEPRDDFAQALSNAKQGTETLAVRPQPGTATLGLSGNGFIFDKNHYGVFPLSIPNAKQVERVKLAVETAPWQAQSQAQSQGHSHDTDIPSLDVNGSTAAAGGANLIRDTTIDDSLDMNQESVGQQGLTEASADGQNVDFGNAADRTPESQEALNTGRTGSGTSTERFTISNSTSLSNMEYLAIRINMQGNPDGSDRMTAGEYSFFLEDTNSAAFALETHEIDAKSAGLDDENLLVIPTAWIDDDLANLDELVVTVSPDTGTDWLIDVVIHEIAAHTHGPGTLSSSTSGLSGDTDAKSVTPSGTTVADFVSDLLGELRVGYSGASGGTGTDLGYDDSGGNDMFDEHEHSVSATTTQQKLNVGSDDANITIDFGIFQFDGDSGDGTGSPVYGKGIKFAVDPSTDASGIPDQFGSDRVPQSFGTRTEPANIEVDITPYLATDSNGLIKDGPHKVFFTSAADSVANEDGLAVVRVTPIIEYADEEES